MTGMMVGFLFWHLILLLRGWNAWTRFRFWRVLCIWLGCRFITIVTRMTISGLVVIGGSPPCLKSGRVVWLRRFPRLRCMMLLLLVMVVGRPTTVVVIWFPLRIRLNFLVRGSRMLRLLGVIVGKIRILCFLVGRLTLRFMVVLIVLLCRMRRSSFIRGILLLRCRLRVTLVLIFLLRVRWLVVFRRLRLVVLLGVGCLIVVSRCRLLRVFRMVLIYGVLDIFLRIFLLRGLLVLVLVVRLIGRRMKNLFGLVLGFLSLRWVGRILMVSGRSRVVRIVIRVIFTRVMLRWIVLSSRTFRLRKSSRVVM